MKKSIVLYIVFVLAGMSGNLLSMEHQTKKMTPEEECKECIVEEFNKLKEEGSCSSITEYIDKIYLNLMLKANWKYTTVKECIKELKLTLEERIEELKRTLKKAIKEEEAEEDTRPYSCPVINAWLNTAGGTFEELTN